MLDEAHDPRSRRNAKGRGFFALDVHQFERIRRHGLGVEEAATYLCLLTSTDQSNIASSGGVNSVMEYAGLSRAETKRAIRNLEGHGLIQCLEVARKRARTVTRYNLPIHENRTALSPKETGVVEGVRAGRQPTDASAVQAAYRAKDKGWIEKTIDGWQAIKHANDVAFIPNSFVRAKEGPSPLGRLVNNGELAPILLAVELYQLQNLMDERGVPAAVIRGHFHASCKTWFARHTLHHLEPGRLYEDPDTGETASSVRSQSHKWRTPGIWDQLSALESAHVVEWAVYSSNGRPSGRYAYNRPQRPLGVLRNGKQVWDTPESRPALMAHLLWRLKQQDDELPLQELPQLIAEWRDASSVIALENRSVSHVEGVGILRMTHRAATNNTSVWYRDLLAACEREFLFLAKAAQDYFPQAYDWAMKTVGVQKTEDAISILFNDGSM